MLAQPKPACCTARKDNETVFFAFVRDTPPSGLLDVNTHAAIRPRSVVGVDHAPTPRPRSPLPDLPSQVFFSASFCFFHSSSHFRSPPRLCRLGYHPHVVVTRPGRLAERSHCQRPHCYLACIFSRERLRRVLRKKTSAELRLIYIFASSPLHVHILTYISAHVHICASTSLLIFTSAHLHLRSSSHLHIYISQLHLSLFFTLSLKAGGGAARKHETGWRKRGVSLVSGVIGGIV